VTKLACWRRRTFIALGLLLAVGTFFLLHGHSRSDAEQEADIFLLRWDDSAEECALPASIAVDSNGHLYVADSEDHYIQDLGPASGIVANLYAGSGERSDGPYGVAVDAQGYVYVADFGKGRVQKFDPEGNLVAEWENEEDPDGNSPMDAEALGRRIRKLAEETRCLYMLVAIRDD